MTPPNSVKVSPNFYSDQTETSNFNWCEYAYWTETVFGSASDEFLSTHINESDWLELDTSAHHFEKYYLKHVTYRDYPLIGVSQAQAQEFTKWRSDRVFEGLLVKYGVIEWDSAQTEKTYFTIDKYFNNEYKGVIADTNLFYPEFRIPTEEEWIRVLNFNDSVYNQHFTKCKSQHCKLCKEKYPEIHSDIIPFKNTDITINIYSGCTTDYGTSFYNLRGNVSEWIEETNYSIGGGWKNSREDILNNNKYYLDSTNAWTGFRNVCMWKKWK